MSRVELLRASSIKAEARYRQELSSVRSLRQAESRERQRAAESRKEFWKQATVAAEAHAVTPREQTSLSAAERMWRAHETLKSALAKHNEALGRLQLGGERLASAQERIDVLEKMVGAAKRQRACRAENQRSDELGDLLNSLARDRARVRVEARLNRESTAVSGHATHDSVGSWSGAQEGFAERLVVTPPVESSASERVCVDPRIAVTRVSAEDIGNQKALTVECSLGAKGEVSVSLVKRDGEAIKAVVSPEGARLALSTLRDRALVLSRLWAIGVRVGSLSVGHELSGGASDKAGQRLRRRSRQEDDESRIA